MSYLIIAVQFTDVDCIDFSYFGNGLKFWLSSSFSLISRYWRRGQPDNYEGSEDCAQIAKGHPVTENWNDYPCSIAINFVCEKML